MSVVSIEWKNRQPVRKSPIEYEALISQMKLFTGEMNFATIFVYLMFAMLIVAYRQVLSAQEEDYEHNLRKLISRHDRRHYREHHLQQHRVFHGNPFRERHKHRGHNSRFQLGCALANQNDRYICQESLPCPNFSQCRTRNGRW